MNKSLLRSLLFIITCTLLLLSNCLLGQTIVREYNGTVYSDPNQIINGCGGLAVEFSVSPQAGHTYSNFSWSIVSGGTSTPFSSLANPFEQFNTPGLYSVEVTYTDDVDGVVTLNTAANSIVVFTQPSGSFYANRTNVCVGDNITLYNTTPGTFNSLEFLVDNQLYTVTGDSAVITLNNPGQFEVALSGSSSDGCSFIYRETDYITVQAPFTTTFTASQTLSCAASQLVTFTATSTDVDGNTVNPTYYWDFDDGTLDTTSTATTSHTFNSGGGSDFTVTLASSLNNCDGTSTDTEVISFRDVSNLYQNAVISGTCNTYVVTYNPNLVDPLFSGGQLTWDWGDGTIETINIGDVATHTYSNPTPTPVVVNISANVQGVVDNSCTFTDTQTIPILPQAGISIAANDVDYCSNNFSVIVNAVNLQNVTNFYWVVDGGVAQGANEMTDTLNVVGFGTHNIELWFDAQTGDPNDNCALNTIEVYSAPIDIAIAGPIIACEPSSDTFTPSVTWTDRNGATVVNPFTVNSESWDVLNTNTGVTTNYTSNPLTFTNLPHGLYEIEYTVNTDPIGDNAGCSYTSAPYTYQVGEVFDFPTLNASPTTICIGTTVAFSTTTNADTAGLGLSGDYPIIYEYQYANNLPWVTVGPGGNGAYYYGDIVDDNRVPLPATFQVSIRAVINGCTGQPTTRTITINPSEAEHEITTDDCNPTSLTIVNNSLGTTDTDYQWTVTIDPPGNGAADQVTWTSQVTKDENYIFTADGTFPTFTGYSAGEIPESSTVDVRITATEPGNGCSDVEDTTIVMPGPLPILAPTPSISTGTCINQNLVFDAGDGNLGALYSWTFTQIADPTIQFTFASNNSIVNTSFPIPGEYNGQVTVTTTGGCTFSENLGPIQITGGSVTVTGAATACVNQSLTFQGTNLMFSPTSPTYEWFVDGASVATGTVPGTGLVPDLTGVVFSTPNSPQSLAHTITLELTVNGCSASYSHDITVTKPEFSFPLPHSNFVSFDYICDEVVTVLDLDLDVNEVYNLNTATINFFTGGVGVGQVTPNSITNDQARLSLPAGTYTLTVEVTDENGCSDNEDLSFTVPTMRELEAGFTPNVTNLVCPGFVSFTDLANETAGNTQRRDDLDITNTLYDVDIALWQWDFDNDGSIDATTTTGSVTHYYDSPGTYDATVTVTDDHGCQDTATPISIVVGGTSGSYEILKKIGFAPATTQMVAFPVDDPNTDITNTIYQWSSGDGQLGTDSLNTFTYSSTLGGAPISTFTPNLTFIDENGCSYPAAYSGDMTVLSCPDISSSDITLCTDIGSYNLNVEDMAWNSSYNASDTIETTEYMYYWDLEYQWYVDGALISAADGGTDPDVTFIHGPSFSTPWTVNPNIATGRLYRIEARIVSNYIDKIDPTNNSLNQTECTMSDDIRVIYNPTPVANFTNDEVCEGSATTLDARPTDFGIYNDQAIAQFEWDIDNDGTYDITTTDSVTTYTFPTQGIYIVNLRTTSADGCIDTFTENNVVVNANPTADFTYQNVCQTSNVAFVDNSTITPVTDDEIVRWDWDFNSNGTIDFGGTDTLAHRFPTIDFTTQLDGNGTLIGNDQVLTTTLTVTTNKGCTHSFTANSNTTLVYMFNNPDSELEAERLSDGVANEVCLGQTMQFRDRSTVDNSNLATFIAAGDIPANVNDIVAWFWDFGDGNTSNAQDPQHLYAASGAYNVTLVVTTARGCNDVDNITVNVRENPDPEIGQDSIIVNDDVTVQLRPVASSMTNFAYQWSVLSGPTNGTVTQSALNIHNATVDTDETDFNNGESVIDIRYQLEIIDNNFPTACTTYDTVDVQFHRVPRIDLDTTLNDCGTTASYIARPFGTEIISGFNYAWTNVVTTGGTVTITDPTLQDFTITPTSFDAGSTRIHTKYYIDVTNSIGGADRDSIEFYFYREPDYAAWDQDVPICSTADRNLYTITFNPFGTESLPHGNGYNYSWSMTNTPADHNVDPAFLGDLVNQVTTNTTDQNLSLTLTEDYFVDDSVNLSFDITLLVENTYSNTCQEDTTVTINLERIPRNFTLTDPRVDPCNLSVTLNHHTETLDFRYRWRLQSVTAGYTGGAITESYNQTRTLNFTDANFATGFSEFTVTMNNRVRKMNPNTGLDASPHCGLNRNIDLVFYRTPSISFTETKLGGNPCAASAEISSGAEVIPGFTYSWNQTSITGGTLSEDALNNKDINLTVASWDLNQTIITATYELTVTNTNSPTCKDVQSYTIQFFRTPEIDYTPSSINCILTDTITANSEALSGATFFWNVNSLTGGTIDSTNNGNQYIIEVDDFDVGSHRLDAQYNLQIMNSTMSTCDDDTTFNISFYRTPDISFVQTRTDSCALVNTLQPFGTEVIAGYNYTWRELYVNGGTVTTSSLTDQDLTVTANTFDQDTAYIVVAYELTARNTDSFGCTDVDTVEFRFYRTPNVDNYTTTVPLDSCGLYAFAYPLGQTEIINHGSGFDYTWTFDSVTGAGADGMTLPTAIMDSITNKQNDQNFGLIMPITAFASGSHEIQLTLDLHIEHSETNVTCSEDTTITLSFKRPPVIDMQEVKVDSCAYTSSLQPFGAEAVAGFNYQWQITDITGYDGNDGNPANDLAIGNLATTQDLSITITDDDFIDTESKITIALQLDVSNSLASGNTSCQDISFDTLTFYRTPIIDPAFAFNKLANCDHTGTIEPFPTNINGFVYVWTPVTVNGGAITNTSLTSRQITLDVDSFDTNSLQIDGTYRLRVFNAEVPSCFDQEDVNFEFYRTPEITFSDLTIPCAIENSSITLSTMNEAFTKNGETFIWHLDNITGGTIDSTNNNSEFIVDVDTWDTNSAQIDVQYTVSISNSSAHTCDDDTTFSLTFYRQPEIQFLSTRADSCAQVETMEAFNGESLPLFARTWRQLSVTGGSVTQNSVANDPILEVEVDTFALHSAEITVQYELIAQNTISPTCFDTDTVEFKFYRNPDFTAYIQNDPFGLCGGLFRAQPLGMNEVINHGTGFDYQWTLDPATVTGAAGGVLISSVMDSINFYQNMQDMELHVPDSAYADGSNMIQFEMDLEIKHSNPNLAACSVTDTTILFQYLRYPDIVITETRTDSCDLSTTLQPFGTEMIGGYNYDWEITNITGYDGSTYSVGDSYTSQNTVFTVTDTDFDNTESHIAISIRLTVENQLGPADPSCTNTVNYVLNFYRTPDIQNPFLAQKAAQCDWNASATPFPTDVNGYTYVWSIDSIRNGAITDNSALAQRELLVQVDSFDNLESIMYVHYKLRVINTLSNDCFDEDTVSFVFYRTPEIQLTNLSGACQNSINVSSHNEMLNDVDFDWNQNSITGGTIVTNPVTPDGNRDVTFNVGSFNAGASQIDANYTITMLNSGASMCDDDTIFNFTLFREPEINLTYTRASNDSCSNNLTLRPYASEYISGFTNNWSQLSINGGAITTSSLTNEDLTLTVDTFAINSTRIDTRYAITSFNTNSPACEDSSAISTTLYRQPDFTAFVEQRTAGDCGLSIDFYPLGLTENIAHNSGFDYTWTLDALNITGAGADGSTLHQAVLDSINNQVNDQNFSLEMPMDAFADGSNTIVVPMTIEIQNSDQNSCVASLDTSLIFYRPATIDIQQSLVDCGVENIITPYGTENVSASFNFNWTIAAVGGTITNSSLTDQDLTLNAPVFNAGSDTILVDVTLNVENAANTLCEKDTAFRFYFYRQPNIVLNQNMVACDTVNLITSLGVETINGFDYLWDSLSVIGGDVIINAPYSISTQNIEFAKSAFDSGSHKIVADYRLTVSNQDTLGNSICNDIENVNFTMYRTPNINVVQSLTAGDCGAQNNITLFDNETITGFNVTWTEVSVNGGSINLSSTTDQNVTFNNPVFDPASNQIDVNYTVYVENSESATCNDTETVTFTFYRTPDATIASINPECSNTSITLNTVENYVPQFNYSWNLLNTTADNNPNAEALTSPAVSQLNNSYIVNTPVDQTGFFPTGAAQMTYQYEVVVTNNLSPTCFDRDTIEANFYRMPIIAATQSLDSSACEQNNIIRPFGTEVIPNFAYNWSQVSINGGSIDTTHINNGQDVEFTVTSFDSLSHRIDVSYTVDVSNLAGSCSDSETFNFTFFRTPQTDLSMLNLSPVCRGTQVVLFPTEANNPGYQYTWNRISILTDNGIDLLTGGVYPIESGLNTHTITLDHNPAFPNTGVRVTAVYELQVMNMDNGCITSDQVTVVFDREAMLDLTSSTFNVCDDTDLTLQTVEQRPDNYNYTWTIDSIYTDNSAEISNLMNFDTSVGGALTIDTDPADFPSGATLITAVIDVDAQNQLNNNCSADTSYTVELARRPMIAFTDNHAECALDTVTIRPFGNETINGFDYTWSITSIDGFNGTTADIINGQTNNQNLSLHIDDDDFMAGRSQVEITFDLVVDNPNGPTCSDNQTHTLIFFRVPNIDFTATKAGNDSCANEITISPFSETVSDYQYAWSKLNEVNGSVSEVNTSVRDLVVNTPVFDQGENQIDVTYELQITNMNPLATSSCVTTEQVTISFFKTPVLATNLNTNVIGCGDQAMFKALTFPITADQRSNYVFEWTLNSVNGGTVDTLSRYDSLEMNRLTFDNGSGTVEVNVDVTARNAYQSTSCFSTQNDVIEFYRIPNNTLTPSSSDICEDQSIVITTGEELVSDFDYVWSLNITDDLSLNTGTIDTTSLGSGGHELTMRLPTFPNGTSYIEVEATLVTTHRVSGCADTEVTTVRFHRQPTVSLIASPITSCETGSITIRPTEGEVSNFNYTWTRTQFISDVSDNTGINLVETPSASNYEMVLSAPEFPQGAAQVTARYKLTIGNQTNPYCASTSDSIDITFFRTPEAVLGNDSLLSCGTTQFVIQPVNEEQINNFNYNWTVDQLDTDITSNDGRASVSINTNGDYAPSVMINTIPVDASYVTAHISLATQNTFSSCGTSTDQQLVTFLRTPEVTLPQTGLSGCDNSTFNVQPSEVYWSGMDYQWSLIDVTGGSVATQINLTGHNATFADPVFDDNAYQVTAKAVLNVSNRLDATCEASDTTLITFYRTPVAGFAPDNGFGCQGLVVNFNTDTSISPDPNSLYEWDFNNDGTYDDSSNGDITYTFNTIGTHTVNLRITTPTGCVSNIASYNVEVYEVPTASFTVNDICLGDIASFLNTTPQLASSGNHAIQTVEWDFDYDSNIGPNFGAYNTRTTDATYEYPEAGTFAVLVKVTNVGGCSNTFVDSIKVTPPPVLTMPTDVWICTDGTTTITPTTDVPVTYNWSTGATTPTIDVAPSTETTYTLTVTNDVGCTTTQDITIHIVPDVVEGFVMESCDTDPITFDGRIPEYPGIVQSYEWSTGETTPTIEVLETGTYTLRTIVEHESGTRCEYTHDYQATFHPNPGRVLEDTTFCFEFGDVLEIAAVEGDNFTYSWNTGETTRVVTKDRSGIFTVTVIDETHDTRCSTVDTINVNQICPPRMFAPNAFTPNGDGNNDEFLLEPAYAIDIELHIYNNWGESIFHREYRTSFEANTKGNGWDGTYKNAIMMSGNYNYTIRYVSEIDGSVIEKQGSILLIR
ncbi:PKD domain-containing protein [Flammeovirga sp. MY04]|uniref:PKD domain-containing protein n=1 Tax=Flammeovirga sp. MY04 TaxID=1191459 RepID=UPI0009FD8BC7|nr:PKD domain-containing protein [Flammeovirga sp. MY04]ANQ48564.2 PKD domain-containing protein [Flammeovirga sp. MY04]